MSATIETLQLELRDSMDRVDGLEVLVVSANKSAIRVKFRAKEENTWLKVLYDVLKEPGSYTLFVGKEYFIHEDGKMYFVWVMILEAEDLADAVFDMRSKLLQSVGLATKRVVDTNTDIQKSTDLGPLPYLSAGWAAKRDRRTKSARDISDDR